MTNFWKISCIWNLSEGAIELQLREKEIDFIARKNTSKIYIQVTYLLESQNTIEHEFRAYERIKDNFPKYVISMDNFGMSRNGIKHWNIKDILLADQWN